MIYFMVVFLKGFIMGLAIAAPVGPIGILCIQRTLHTGFSTGLMTGLGAALADGTYGLIAGFGLTIISSFLVKEQFWIRAIGALFLIYLGIKLLFKKPTQGSFGNTRISSWYAFGTSYVLTLTNPATILSFMAIFAGLGLGTIHNNFLQALALILGIVCGSALWWLLLSGGVAFILHHQLNAKVLRNINRASGVAIIVFGLVILVML
jgi:threonine/homoserine/homoserine lactone efflux protein